ncbi:hypothetical protein NMY22_g8305 [Coprinellus aureogranulatus]|nr:hypothetical protein NMY22_g8305 [Coprinellus aureogranulatus]
MDLDKSPIFRYFPWLTELPFGDYDATFDLFDADEDEWEENDSMCLEEAATANMRAYEQSFAERTVPSNIARSKKDRIKWKDLFHKKEAVEKRRTGVQNKLETQVIRPVWTMLVCWKVIERMKMVKEMRESRDQGGASVKKPILSDEEAEEIVCERLKVIPYNETLMEAGGYGKDGERIGDQASKTLLDSRSAEKNLQDTTRTTAIMLHLLLEHGMLDLSDQRKEDWERAYGDTFSGLTAEEQKSLTTELDGPLQIAAMLDPIAIFCNKQIARSSPCMEECIVASKAVGSPRDPGLNSLNTCLWDLLINVALGVTPISEVAFELKEIFSNSVFRATLKRSSDFYEPDGVEMTVAGEGGSEKKIVTMVRISDMGTPVSIFDRNSEAVYDPNKRQRRRKVIKDGQTQGGDGPPRADSQDPEEDEAAREARLAAERAARQARKDEEERMIQVRRHLEAAAAEKRKAEREARATARLLQEPPPRPPPRAGPSSGSRRTGQPNHGSNAMDVDAPPRKSAHPTSSNRKGSNRPKRDGPFYLVDIDTKKKECLVSVVNRAYTFRPKPPVVDSDPPPSTQENNKGLLIYLVDAYDNFDPKTPLFKARAARIYWDELVRGVSLQGLTKEYIEKIDFDRWQRRVDGGVTHVASLKCVLLHASAAPPSTPSNATSQEAQNMYKQKVKEIGPPHAMRAVYDQSVDDDSSPYGVERMISLAAMVSNSDVPFDRRIPFITDKSSCVNDTHAMRRPIRTVEQIWAATTDLPYLGSRNFPMSVYAWSRTGTDNTFHPWETATWGLMQHIEVTTGELAMYVSEWIGDSPDFRPTELVPIIARPPDHSVQFALRLLPETILVMPPGSSHAPFAMTNTVWVGGYCVDWSSMLPSLTAACRYLAAGRFTSSTSTVDLCEGIVRFLYHFYYSFSEDFSDGDSLPNLVPSLNTPESCVQISALFCWVTLANVLMPETYVPDPLGDESAFLKYDSNQVPRHLREALAYGRGLLEIFLARARATEDMTRSFRNDLYLPMLAKVSSYLRSEFVRLNPRGGAQEGFWTTPSRISRFDRQLNLALARVEEKARPSDFSEFISQGTTATWDAWITGYDFHLPFPELPHPDLEETMLKGMTSLDILFFWNLSDSRRGYEDSSDDDDSVGPNASDDQRVFGGNENLETDVGDQDAPQGLRHDEVQLRGDEFGVFDEVGDHDLLNEDESEEEEDDDDGGAMAIDGDEIQRGAHRPADPEDVPFVPGVNDGTGTEGVRLGEQMDLE